MGPTVTSERAMTSISLLKRIFHRKSERAPHGGENEPASSDYYQPKEDSPHSDASVIERVVNNRVFLLGLDELYRERMKEHEREELLACAQRVASTLNVPLADVPVEGYYAEEEELTKFFLLIRALQNVPLRRASKVKELPEFRRLLAVTSSPIFGPVGRGEDLLPKGKDPLSAALQEDGAEWSVPPLVAAAARIAVETDDYSLVGLAALAKDPVVLAALRESVVLYAEIITKEFQTAPRLPKYVWRVDPELAAAAQRFVAAFNTLFGNELPSANAKNAQTFWEAYKESEVVGRCVRLGQTPDAQPRYYHWAVIQGPDDQLGVREF